MFKFGQKGRHDKRRPQQRKTSGVPKGELIDPILYVGDLDEKKYPRYSSKDIDNKNDKPEKEIENPLNKR